MDILWYLKGNTGQMQEFAILFHWLKICFFAAVFFGLQKIIGKCKNV